MNNKKKLDILIIILLAFLLIATVLIFVKFSIAKKLLSDSSKRIQQIQEKLNPQSQPLLTAPILRTSDPVNGQPTAEHTIFIFASFTCTYSQQQAEILNELIKNYPNRFFLVWKDLASTQDSIANNAAIAARCAQEQNSFWLYHDYLYANQESLNSETYLSIANELGLDINKFNSCLQSQEPVKLIASDLTEALALGLDATPYLFIDGQRVDGVITLQSLEEALEL